MMQLSFTSKKKHLRGMMRILLWVPIPDPALHFKHESNETLNPIDRRIERGICDHCQWKKCMDGYTGRMMV
jgi:hypothetical protein